MDPTFRYPPGSTNEAGMRVVLVFFEKISARRKTGFGYVSYTLAKRLHDAGHLKRVICLSSEGDLDIPDGKIISLAEHWLFGFLNQLLARLSRVFPGFDTRLRREILFDRFVCRYLGRHEGDLVFFSRPLFLHAAEKAKAAGLEVWIQSSVPHPMVNYELVRNEERRLDMKQHGAYSSLSRAQRLTKTIATADRIVTLGPSVGRYTYNTYSKALGPDRILPLENVFSISVDGFRDVAGGRTPKAGADPVTFLHVSHINLIKGIPYLLDAWRSFLAKGIQGCRLILIGSVDKTILDLMERDYADLPDFEYLGFAANLAEAYASGDVFISPSISDNGPGTIIEAMATGMPVISSRNCGLASLVVEEKNGFTYEYNDTEQLTRILVWFAQNRGRIHDLGRNARRTAEKLTGNHYTDEMLAHFEILFGTTKAPPQ
jgi:glycosyltransferase involved in cell wall biosynthesis